MALVEVVLVAILLAGFCLGFASLGIWALRAVRHEMPSDAEHLLIAIAVGLLITEILLFLIQFTQRIKLGSFAIASLLFVVLMSGRRSVWHRLRRALRQIAPLSSLSRFLLLLIGIVVCVEFLAAMAPLTGSDALHYHFTVQKQILQQGFHPFFSNSHSFVCGQHHLLILFGLALGSERLALGFIFFGGLLVAASMACLSGRWVPDDWIVVVLCLLFLLTPVVFWQISTAGAPDIYMAFLLCGAVMVLRQEVSVETGIWRRVVLAGFLAGGIAGAKYTGCLIAAAFAVSVALEFRSVAHSVVFTLAALLSGIWPYFRNLMWTGNPVFPFVSAWTSPKLATAFAVANLAADTGASSRHPLSQLIPFSFLAAMQAKSLGFWDFFGPTVFALAPLILLAFRNTRAWRVSILVWLLSGVGIFFASGLPRFLLPVFPMALSCTAAGLAAALRRKWSIASGAAVGLVVLMVLAGMGGLAMYCRRPVLAAIGIVNKAKYLEQTSQDYEVVEAVNRLLGGQGNQKRALVFIRHMYYLDAPYLNGDPGTSFEVDPEHLDTTKEWRAFFENKGIDYVVRSPEYPAAIARSLMEMERLGDLAPFAHAEVENIQGKRMDEQRSKTQVVILKVRH